MNDYPCLALRSILLAGIAIPLAACATVPTTMEAGPTAAPPVTAQQAAAEVAPGRAAASEALAKLFRDSDEDNLRRNPLGALFRGDMRYADQLGDNITDAYFAGEREAAQRELAALAQIDRTALDATDQLAYDTFQFQQREALRGLTPEMLALTAVRPINHFFGFHTFYPNFASGQGAAPFTSVADYENNLKRHTQFATLIDRSIGRFREGMASGVFETKLTITNVITQLDTQLAQPIEESPYFGPTKTFPDSFTDAQKAEHTAKLRASLTDEVMPSTHTAARFPAR